jgi:phosphoribosylglycinamide formyltransferase-1
MDKPLPIAVLASGGGTNLQALLDTVHGHEAEVVAVASGTPGAHALDRASEHGVATELFVRSDYADRQARDLAIADWLAQRGARLVVLAYGVKVFGVTVHFVDDGCDTGPVISQRAIELPDARDPDEVLAALRPLEHELLGEAVRLFARGALVADPDNPRRIAASARAQTG